MRKPIFIAPIPTGILDRDKLLKQVTEVQRYIEQDYYFLPILESGLERVRFECYNSPHTEIEFKELKEKVLSILNNLKT